MGPLQKSSIIRTDQKCELRRASSAAAGTYIEQDGDGMPAAYGIAKLSEVVIEALGGPLHMLKRRGNWAKHTFTLTKASWATIAMSPCEPLFGWKLKQCKSSTSIQQCSLDLRGHESENSEQLLNDSPELRNITCTILLSKAIHAIIGTLERCFTGWISDCTVQLVRLSIQLLAWPLLSLKPIRNSRLNQTYNTVKDLKWVISNDALGWKKTIQRESKDKLEFRLLPFPLYVRCGTCKQLMRRK